MSRSNIGTVRAKSVNIVGHGPRARACCGNGTRVRFVLPCGHKQFRDFGKGPIAKRMDALAVRWMVRSWQRSGVYVPACRKCAREEQR